MKSAWATDGIREIYRRVYLAALTDMATSRRLGKPVEAVFSEDDFVRVFCAASSRAEAVEVVAKEIERRLDEAHPGYPYMTRWFD